MVFIFNSLIALFADNKYQLEETSSFINHAETFYWLGMKEKGNVTTFNTVYEHENWVPYDDIDNNLSASLGIIARFSSKMNLVPFLGYGSRYNCLDNEDPNMKIKGECRIRVPKTSKALFESIFKENKVN